MSLEQPTRKLGASRPFEMFCISTLPYVALLRVGFAVPLSLPKARWALTPPFHPYRLISLT